MGNKMLHRDDIPFEEIEKIEAMIREANPGKEFNLIFPGDQPAGTVPKELLEAIAAMERAHEESMERGTCLMCGESIENYEPDSPEWEVPEFWVCVVDSTGRQCGWRCEECSLGPDGMLTVFGDEHPLEEVDENERWTTTESKPEEEWAGQDALEGDFE